MNTKKTPKPGDPAAADDAPPQFVLKPSDPAAPAALRAYADQAESLGLAYATAEAARALAEEFEAWRTKE